MTYVADQTFQSRVQRLEAAYAEKPVRLDPIQDNLMEPFRLPLTERLWLAALYIPIGMSGAVATHTYIAHANHAEWLLGAIVAIFLFLTAGAAFRAAATCFRCPRMNFAVLYTLWGFFGATTFYCC